MAGYSQYLTMRLGIDAAKLQSGLRKATRGVEKFKQDMKRKFGKSLKYVKKFAKAGAAAIAGMVAGLGLMIKKSFKTIDALGKLSNQIDIPIAKLQALRQVADLSGVGADQVSKALEVMSKRLGQAANGTGQAGRALKQLGIPIESIIDKRPDEQFAIISDAIAGMGNAAKQNAAAADLFSRSNQKMVLVAKQGSDAVKQQEKRFNDLGIALTDVDYQRVADANDAITRTGALLSGIMAKLAARIAPFVERAAELFRPIIVSTQKFITKIVNDLKPAVNDIIAVFSDQNGLGGVIRDLGKLIGAILKGGLYLLIGAIRTLANLMNSSIVQTGFKIWKKALDKIWGVLKYVASRVASLYTDVKEFFDYLAGKEGAKLDVDISSAERKVQALQERIEYLQNSYVPDAGKIANQNAINVAKASLVAEKEKLKTLREQKKAANDVKSLDASVVNGDPVDNRLGGGGSNNTPASPTDYQNVNIPNRTDIKPYGDKRAEQFNGLQKQLSSYSSIQQKIDGINRSYRQQRELIIANTTEGEKRRDLLAKTKRMRNQNLEQFKNTHESMSIFAQRASQNIQDTLGNTLEKVLGGSFDNIGKMWINTVQDMAAQAAAAQLNTQLFGQQGKTDGGGWLGKLFNAGVSAAGTYLGGLGGGAGGAGGVGAAAANSATGTSNGYAGFMTGAIKGLASGGRMAANRMTLVGEEGPELVRFDKSGFVTPHDESMKALRGNTGGNTTVNVINNASNTETKQKKRKDENGVEVIDIIVQNMREMVADGTMDSVLSPYDINRNMSTA